jgi:hypothetical protein
MPVLTTDTGTDKAKACCGPLRSIIRLLYLYDTDYRPYGYRYPYIISYSNGALLVHNTTIVCFTTAQDSLRGTHTRVAVTVPLALFTAPYLYIALC